MATEFLKAGEEVASTDVKTDGGSSSANYGVKGNASGRINDSWTEVQDLTGGETISGATTPVAAFISDSDNEVYACDANDTSKLEFRGFVTGDTTDGGSCELQTAGVVPGFTGLTAGAKYYVQDDKTIGTTPGTYRVFVGIALSTTQILIANDQMNEVLRGNAVTVGTAAGDYSHTGDTNWTDVDATNLAITVSPLKKGILIRIHYTSDFTKTASDGYQVRVQDTTNNVTLDTTGTITIQTDVEREEELLYVPATAPITIKLQFKLANASDTVRIRNSGTTTPDIQAITALPL